MRGGVGAASVGRWGGLVLALVMAFPALAPWPGQGQEPPPGGRRQGFLRPGGMAAGEQEGITLNFQNNDLASVLTAMGQAAGINVVLSNIPSVQVTLRTAQPVGRLEVASLIRSLAAAHGVAVSEEPGFLRLQGPATPQEGEAVPRQLYIQRLRHANALTMASTLQALFGAGGARGGTPAAANRTQGAQTLSQQLRAMEQTARQTQGVGAQPQPQPQPMTITVGSADLQGEVQIVADEVSNSLLVRATAQDWTVLEQAIAALDLRPLQVVIEVVIAEVRRTGDLNLGVGFSASDVKTQGGEGTTGILPVTASQEAFTLDIFRTGDVNVAATLAALSASGNVRILSRPLIQAQNNQEARILVGSERPFIQAYYTTAAGQPVTQQVVQYRDVGTALTIRPTINEDGYVNLLLTQEVSNATAETQFGAPVISTREATTQILARSGQTVVIGGLVDQQRERSRVGIPFLKDIPFLGFLFGTTRETVSNSELFLFLTPYVVANDEDERRLREELEKNAELLKGLIPIRSLLPPMLRAIVPDTLAPDTLGNRRSPAP